MCSLSDKKTFEYDTLLAINVRWGTFIAVVFSLLFVLIYTWGGYPHIMVIVNGVSLVLNLLVMALAFRGCTHRFLAHVITFTVYNSMMGAAVFSGGIASSSIVWLLVVPLVATLITGRRGGILWGAISVLTGIFFYLWAPILDAVALIPATNLDRAVDLLAALLTVIVAVWISETIRYKVLSQLETARAQLQHLATIDPLTQVYNRRYFSERAARVLSVPQESALLTFDIDYFKTVNDRYGHDVGDQVLQILSRRVLHNLRDGDILARFGGEEFVILLPNTSADVAFQVAERLRRAIAHQPFMVDEAQLRVTISIGITSCAGVIQNPQALGRVLQEADRAMYRAKQKGRNRVEFFSQVDEPLV